MANLQLQEIDWGLLWQQANMSKKQRHKGPEDWDKKAESFAKRALHTIYTEKFLELLAPESDWSVLDIGSGPGTLTLPIAACTRRVTAIDFSENMLKILDTRASEMGLNNISTYRLSWEDDWQHQGIKPHDIAIASRSLAVSDLKNALTKLNNYATKRVCITDRVKHGPKDPDAFAAVGRELSEGPDYIYTFNLLYQMGILPSIEYIRLEKTLECGSLAEALSSYSWMFSNLNTNEEKRLKNYVESISTINTNGTVSVHRRHVPTWAFISWNPTDFV